jgi:hypothetical protein
VTKIKILGWVLLPLNIIGLWFCIYTLQAEINIVYLFAAGLFIAQIIYTAKMLKVLKQFKFAREMLESAAKKAGLSMAKILKGKKGGGEG